MKKLASFLIIGMCLFAATQAQAAGIWNCPIGGDGLWSTPGNWDTGVPGAGAAVTFFKRGKSDCNALSPISIANMQMKTGKLNISSTYNSTGVLYVGMDVNAVPPVLTLKSTADVTSGGTTNISTALGGQGTLNIQDDAIFRTPLLHLCYGAAGATLTTGTLNLTGHAKILSTTAQVGMQVGTVNGTGTLNMTDDSYVDMGWNYCGQGATGRGIFNISGNAIFSAIKTTPKCWTCFGATAGYGELNLSGHGQYIARRLSFGTPWVTATTCQGLGRISGSGLLRVDGLSVGGTGNGRLAGSKLYISGNAVVEANYIEDWVRWTSPNPGNGVIDISEGGVLKIKGVQDVMTMNITNGNVQNLVAGLVATDGTPMIIACGGLRKPEIRYDAATGWTICTAPSLSAAYNPVPSNTQQFGLDAHPATLSWTAGPGAVTHRVFFGTSYNDVNNANVGTPGIYRTATASTSYTIPEALANNTTYYWRIDEVTSSSEVIKGSVWSFYIGNYINIDGFEYADDPSLQAVWSAASPASVSLNSTSAYDGGSKSMKFAYDTSSSPYRNEVTRTFATAQNWQSLGLKSLSLAFLGDGTITNPFAAQMYIKLVDSSNNSKVVNYDGDVNDVIMSIIAKTYGFKTWNIDLALFTGVNMTAIKQITIGFGTGSAPGGANAVLFDTLRAYQLHCVADRTPADLNKDCHVDVNDIALIAHDWLLKDYDLTAASLVTPGPIVSYQFDDVSPQLVYAKDSSGNAYDAGYSDGASTNRCLSDAPLSPAGGGWWNAKSTTKAVAAFIPAEAFGTINKTISVCFWEYGSTTLGSTGTGPVVYNAFALHALAGTTAKLQIQLPTSASVISILTGATTLTYPAKWETDYMNQWNHYAFVKDGDASSLYIYKNGVLIAKSSSCTDSIAGITSAYLGNKSTLDSGWQGRLDDFRIYNYALTQAQVLNIAKVSHLLVDVTENADSNKDGSIDFKDFAVMASAWMTEPLWP